MKRFLFLALSLLSLCFSLTQGEQEMTAMVNATRLSQGLSTLEPNQALVNLARQRSEDMATKGYFSHTTPEGETVFDMLDSLGIPSPYAGEILARTSTSTPAEAILQAFMASPTHRRVILNPHYDYIGVGEAVNAEGLRYITVIFIGGPHQGAKDERERTARAY